MSYIRLPLYHIISLLESKGFGNPPSKSYTSTRKHIIPATTVMCHQVLGVFKCGHSIWAGIVRCEESAGNYNEIFLPYGLEDISRLCRAC